MRSIKLTVVSILLSLGPLAHAVRVCPPPDSGLPCIEVPDYHPSPTTPPSTSTGTVVSPPSPSTGTTPSPQPTRPPSGSHGAR